MTSYLGLKVLIFFIFIDSTIGTFISTSKQYLYPYLQSDAAYGMLQFIFGIPSLFLLRRFIFNYLYKPRLVVQFIMENYYT